MEIEQRTMIQSLIDRINAKRMIGVLIGLFIVEALFLFVVERLRLMQATGDIYELTVVSYLLHLTLAVVITALLGWFYWILRQKQEWRPIATRMPALGIFTILMISATIAIFDQLTTGHITLFTAKLLIFGLLIYIKPPHHTWVFGVPFVLFTAGVFFAQDSQALLTTHVINATVAMGGVVFAGVRFYRLKYYDLSVRITLKKMNKRLETLSTLDPLTHLPNRRFFHKQLTYERAIAKRYGVDASVMMIDIDHFKTINDTYGHGVGDKILVQLAAILTENIRESDTLARWGGEEFILLLSHTSTQGAAIVARRLNETIASYVFLKESEAITLTVSIGVAPLYIEDDLTFDRSYKTVDDALYKAKTSGRNRTVVFDAQAAIKDDNDS